jgi:4-diphosphocytidyl-2C-methyl-D-erythritol kinase
VTPAVAVPTRAAFERYAAGVRPAGAAALATSTHLVTELQAGLSRTFFLERAGVLAFANDLAPAAADLVPDLTRARRALSRLLDRPVGQSGSGPTLWALSASKADAVGDAAIIRAALADGLITFPGDRPPFVAAAALGDAPSSVPS